LPFEREKKVRRKKNEMRCVVSAANKQNSNQQLNWFSHHIKQDQVDANGFRSFIWDINQRLVAIGTWKDGLAQEKWDDTSQTC
jgi:hypothetical protein